MSKLSPRLRRILRDAAKFVGLVGLLVVLMLWLSGVFIGRIWPGPPVPRPKPLAPKTQRVEPKSFPLLVAQTGTVQTRTQARAASRILAQVREVLAHEGDFVVGPGSELAAASRPWRPGPPTVLARLDDREIQARIEQAQAQVLAMQRGLTSAEAQLAAARAKVQAAQARRVQVEADWQRYEELYRKQAATGQQLDHARAQKEEAEAQTRAAQEEVSAAEGDVDKIQAQKKQSEAALNEAQVTLTYTAIEAPFSGLVARKLVDVGDMVSPGQALFLLETPAEPELHAVVAESLVPHLKIGMRLAVHIDALQLVLEGTLRDVVRQADAQTRTVTVKVSMPAQADVLSGMAGHIDVVVGTYEALVVPQQAVQEVGQLYLVEVLSPEGHVERRYVRVGQRHADLVEILAGLRANEEVVVP
jgi:multidrug efflux pump subunit AcrA (membrane-fusion protein)